MKLRCIVERITYQNPENGYTVLKCRVKDYADLVPVVGNLLDVTAGSVLLVEGIWKADPRYGRQFLASSWEETLPATVYGMEKYLGSGLIRGVGPKFARRIVQRFGAETFNVIEDDISRLLEVEGIGNKRVRMIAESWEKQKEIKNVMLFLQEHQVSSSFAAKIYRQYGNESIAVMRENPFRLADDIWGIGFKTADQIAEKLGFAKDSPERLRSGLMYTLSAMSDEGHVYAEKKQLTEAAAKLLEAAPETILPVMEKMLQNRELIGEEIPAGEEKSAGKGNPPGEEKTTAKGKPGEAEKKAGTENRSADEDLPGGTAEKQTAVYLPPFYYAETGTAAKLRKLLSFPASDRLYRRLAELRAETGNETLSVDVGKISEKTGMSYDEIQAGAIRMAAGAKVMILTGGPGTGKTTTVRGIIAAYRAWGLKVLLAAPTGRAAKRMTEAAGLEAKTIHRLLECKPPEGFQKNEENPLEGDVLILDECSMIDIILMNALLKAIPAGMRLILVGDTDQLPSVGAGNVLRDLIGSGAVPVVRLTRIFRQAQESRIIMNAHRINQGKLPDLSNGKNSDFFFLENEDPESVCARIVTLVKEKLPAYYHVKPSEIQVLTPMQRGSAGAVGLNLALQEALNPAEYTAFFKGRGPVAVQKDALRRSGFSFRADDKVMQIRNNYEKDVYNGDIGIIRSVSPEEQKLTVSFDGREVGYDVTELDELTHAYATTIHKAQGSEYPIVVMPVLMSHYVMLQRNLIYTGITRAKKILVLIGTKKALAYAVRHVTVSSRNTMLKERLAGTVITAGAAAAAGAAIAAGISIKQEQKG